MMLILSERANVLDAQLRSQIELVHARSGQVTKLNTVIARLRDLIARFPAGASADLSPFWVGASAADLQGLRDALTDANVTTLDVTRLHDATLGALRGAVDHTRAEIDRLSNTQQLDLLRLQSMANRRNEALDLISNALKKLGDAQASILGERR